MGFKEMMLKAKSQARAEHNGEWIAAGQTGTILVHSLVFYETTAGKFGALNGEIVEARATTQGALVQPKGTKVKSVFVCNGKFADMGLEKLYKCLKAIYDPATDEELVEAAATCFGSAESGFSNKASLAEQDAPLFAARGCLVGFNAKLAKNSDERTKAGKEAITNVYFEHVKQTAEEIAERAAELPPAV